MALAAVLVVAAPEVAHGSSGLALRGFGTPVVDGVLSPGEWDMAGRFDFQANRSPAEGGGTVPATLFVMNDSTNLYLALRVSVVDLGDSTFDGLFAPPGGSPFAPGSDILRAVTWEFEDSFYRQTGPDTWEWSVDESFGGTNDGTSQAEVSNGVGVFEVEHPLNDSDDLHDFSLAIPSHVDYIGLFQHCIASSCGFTNITSDTAKIEVVSGTRVPPQTTITAGPAEGAQVPDYGTWEFAGSDDVAPASEITFQCSVDSGQWEDCETPYGPATTDDGWHTFSVRALDDMLNADPTPAQRRWRIDTTSPSKPKVVRHGRTLHFSAKDVGTPRASVHFRCAVEAKRLHSCGARLRVPGGRHIIRVRAVDPAGNESSVKIVRLSR